MDKETYEKALALATDLKAMLQEVDAMYRRLRALVDQDTADNLIEDYCEFPKGTDPVEIIQDAWKNRQEDEIAYLEGQGNEAA